jgi:general secretion pathway protein A
MYTQFFGLREKPFSLSPDPRYLYLSDSHREALAHLLYGIEQGEGFIAITGEVGTGKTTLCRTLLERIEPGTEVAFIFNPQLSGFELLQSIAAELGLETEDRNRREINEALNRFLLAKRRDGRRVLLIIDEAQVLERETLEQVRLLSNLETSTSKLIQIILIGQPELDTVLEAPDLRQLRQRITVRWRLQPLTAAESREYVRHRIRIAAGEPRELFTEGALREIHRHSHGVPRLINLLCDRSLLAGFGATAHQVGLGLVTQVERELRVGGAHDSVIDDAYHRKSPWKRAVEWASNGKWLAPAATLAAVVVALVLVLASVAPGVLGLDSPELDPDKLPPQASTATGSAPPADLAPVEAPPPVAAAPPIVAPTPVAPDLNTALARVSPAATTARSLDALLAAWGATPVGAELLSRAQADAALVAEGFSVLELDGLSLDQLATINRPALLTLHGLDETPRRVLLTRMDAELAYLFGIDGVSEVGREELVRHWDGVATIPWRDFAELPETLRLGMTGDSVQWLQRALDDVGIYSDEFTGNFDARTEAAVRLFQSRVGLHADGHVGPLTKIRLYEVLERYGEEPRLRSGS